MQLAEDKNSNIHEFILLTCQLQKQMLVFVSFLQEVRHIACNSKIKERVALFPQRYRPMRNKHV
jgi:hypothetical protein